MSRRTALPLALLLSLGLLLAACGGDDGGDDSAEASTTTEADEQATTSTADETTTTAAPTEGGGDTAAGGLPTLEEIEALDDFCAVWTTGESLNELENISEASPEEIQTTSQALNALLVQGIATAPDEIRGDFTAMAESIQGFYAILADYEFDPVALSQAAANDPELGAQMEAIFSAEFEQQNANVDAWVEANC
jgi:hypothetical protein